ATTEPRLATKGTKRAWIAWPADPEALAPRRVEVERIPADAATFDLGVVTMPPRGPRLVVVLPEAPKGAVQVRLTRERRSQVLDADSKDREAVLYDPWDAPGL